MNIETAMRAFNASGRKRIKPSTHRSTSYRGSRGAFGILARHAERKSRIKRTQRTLQRNAQKGGKTEGRTEILYPDIQFSQSAALSRSTPVFIRRASILSILSILSQSDRYSPGASARVCLQGRRVDGRVAGRRRRVTNGGGERRCTTRRNPAEPGKAERARERVATAGIRNRDGARERRGREKEKMRENYTTVGADVASVSMRAAGRSAFARLISFNRLTFAERVCGRR